MRLYLAYGSNMCREQMASRCPGAFAIGTVVVPGWRFIINRLGVAAIVADPSTRIHGLVWTLPPPDEATLDIYEGVADGEYTKQIMPLDGHGTAMFYAASDTDPGPPRPGYLERIIAAAAREGLPDDYVSELATWL